MTLKSKLFAEERLEYKMEAIEIILLIAGVLIFIISFIVPAKSESMSAETKETVQKEIEELISADVSSAKERINNIVDETVTYSIEKTERSMERLSNEKIMAVSEYADTVLEEINKTHTEVMFLYDMLNDKHQKIKDTVAEVTQTVMQAERTIGETEFLGETETPVAAVRKESKKTRTTKKATTKETKVPDSSAETVSGPDLSFIKDVGGNVRNNNERILELHKQGKSNVAIAKELGLGIGEVKLVIGLFEGI